MQRGNRNRWRAFRAVLATAGLGVLLSLMVASVAGQAPAYKAPRTADGKPDLNGIWQALNTANWDIQDHPAAPAPLVHLGAIGAVPPGQGVVEGNEIPYQPWAAAKKKENFEKRLTPNLFESPGDPELKCYMPGVPRATYMPYPFEIVQTPKHILMSYEYASANRLINMEAPTPAPITYWMGWSNGRWEGDTLVVDVTGLNGQAWLDRAGNFMSESAHVVERYTPMSPVHLMYEVTIEDPKVFTRPWKMSMPLYRRMEKNVQLLEFKCIEFTEELLYGHLKKQTTK